MSAVVEPAPDGRRAGQRVVLVAAYGTNRVIGVDGDMPWHIPADFAHFKAETMGHTLVMGRATWDSIGRPLPGRRTIVLTRDADWTAGEYADRVLVAHTFDDALTAAAGLPGDVMVAGGGQVYALALPWATDLVLTEVDLAPAGDAYFPDVDFEGWTCTGRRTGPGLVWSWWQRRATD